MVTTWSQLIAIPSKQTQAAPGENNNDKHLPAIKTPHSHTREIHIVGFFGLKMKVRKYVLKGKRRSLIGHFRVHLSLHFKARLSAKSLLWKSVFIHIEIGTNYHNKSFALRLALKERLRGTRKWPIKDDETILNSSKLWSSQLWTQFKQLRIEDWNGQDFSGVWTRDLAKPLT
mgnify:CR=1 FL=1